MPSLVRSESNALEVGLILKCFKGWTDLIEVIGSFAHWFQKKENQTQEKEGLMWADTFGPITVLYLFT